MEREPMGLEGAGLKEPMYVATSMLGFRKEQSVVQCHGTRAESSYSRREHTACRELTLCPSPSYRTRGGRCYAGERQMAPPERTWAHVCGSGQEGGLPRLMKMASKTHTISHRGACRAPCTSRSAMLCRYLGTCIPQRKKEETLSLRKRVEPAQFL